MVEWFFALPEWGQIVLAIIGVLVALRLLGFVIALALVAIAFVLHLVGAILEAK